MTFKNKYNENISIHKKYYLQNLNNLKIIIKLINNKSNDK